MCVAPSTFHLKHWRRNRKFFRMSYQMIASNADLALAYRSEWKKTVWTSLFWSTNQTSQAFSGTSFWSLPFVLHLNSNKRETHLESAVYIINSDQGVFNTGIRGMCVFTAGVVYSAALWSLSETRSIVIFSRRGFVLQTVYSSFFFFFFSSNFWWIIQQRTCHQACARLDRPSDPHSPQEPPCMDRCCLHLNKQIQHRRHSVHIFMMRCS